MTNLKENIEKIYQSIVAVGFKPAPDQVTIIGSGFSISNNGKILTAAHLYKKLSEEQRKNLMCMSMTKKEVLNYYNWFPVSLTKIDEKNDMALLEMPEHKKTLLKPLELGSDENVREGQEVYFIGFPYAAQLMKDGFGITLIVNKGIISSVKRKAQVPHQLDWFIVDAISNPGNSGCPLIDSETNKVIGVMSIAFRTPSKVQPNLDIREPMHIAGAKPINLAKEILK